MNVLLKSMAIGAIMTVGGTANAVMINGSTSFAGGWTPTDESGNAVSNVADATGIAFQDAFVVAPTGDFAGLTNGHAAVFQDFQFANFVGPVTPLWQINDGEKVYSFDLESVQSNISSNTKTINLSGLGTGRISGLDATPYSWVFSAQGESDSFSFSATSEAANVARVPEPAVLGMLGLGLLGVGLVTRRRRDRSDSGQSAACV